MPKPYSKLKTIELKQTLIDMALRGHPKPKRLTNLGNALARYTGPASKVYDSEFHETIRAVRPEWLVRTSVIKKQKLIEMAKAGEPKPSFRNHPLGKALNDYTKPRIPCFDPVFVAQIREIRPEWLS